MGMPLKNKLILAAIALAVIGMLYVFSREPEPFSPSARDTCPEKGIDPASMVEGTCYDGYTKDVVVDRHHPLRIRTLEARLERIRITTTLTGPQGTKQAKRHFVTFDLAVTNRTDEPHSLEADQIALLLQSLYGQDIEAQAPGYEPHSFQAQKATIPPHGTVHGSVVFDLPEAKQLEEIAQHGNLDIGNFGSIDGGFEPEKLFEQGELGVIRTYRKPES
ncbi:MAG TPA: hypothetical protein VIJ21_03815 [Solirubrobacterales bacterium]